MKQELRSILNKYNDTNNCFYIDDAMWAIEKLIESEAKKAEHNTAYAKLPTLDDIFAHLKDVHSAETINKNMKLLKNMYKIIQKLGNFA